MKLNIKCKLSIGIATAENINTFALLNDKNRLPKKLMYYMIMVIKQLERLHGI